MLRIRVGKADLPEVRLGHGFRHFYVLLLSLQLLIEQSKLEHARRRNHSIDTNIRMESLKLICSFVGERP
jgi:hypothetical protein